MPHTLKDTITIADADGGNARPYKLLEDAQGVLLWGEESVSDDNMPPGDKVIKKTRFWGGGMGERQDMGRGGYFYSENAAHNDPFALKPRSTIGTLELPGNTVPIERFFEADDGTNWYLYTLAQAKSFKIKTITTTPTLAETKTFTVTSYFAQGVYTGDGNATKAITGAGFLPCAATIKGEGTTDTIIRTTDMPANTSKSFDATASSTQGIRTLDADGFTVGNDATVNTDGVKYYWQAWKAGAGRLATGTYNGDDSDDRDITAPGFKPKIVHIARLSAVGIMTRSDSIDSDTDDTYFLSDGAMSKPPLEDRIQALNNDGFQVGTSNTVNENAVAYYWLAIGAVTGQVATGSYEGGTASELAITGIGFPPKYVHIRGRPLEYLFNTYLHGVQRNASLTGDKSEYFDTHAEGTDLIKSLDSDGFTVGNDIEVGRVDYLYHWCAFGDGTGTPQVGKPAKWPTSWRVPLGLAVDAITLSTVAVAPATDTWADIIGLAACHFERRGNKLARATKRHVSLCSADDIGNLANWGAEYGGVAEVAIGAPDVEITDLVEWGNELAVCATDGMYRFDGVATSWQELPLLGGLTDADNGKGTLRWGSYILYPSADGLWRWRYGEHRTIGPDSIPGYGPAKETSNEPVNLKHYGLAFCGDHIYEAAYDGTNYLLIHYRPVGDGFIPDNLLSTTNAIKTVYVDRNRYLWFGYGNDLGYIKLSQGGEPDGGNFGNASLVTTIYERELILADDADVRLRMVKVITRNMDVGGADTYKWELHASRDGAAFGAQIGEDIQGAAMDGVNKRYWTAASNLKARRLRLKEVGTATAGYTPTTTAPEIIGLGVFGETVPDDATIIRCVIDLERSGRTAKTVKSELRARENAGVVQVRDPVSDEVLSMIIYRCDLAEVRQKGHEEPRAAMVVYMRYGDVS